MDAGPPSPRLLHLLSRLADGMLDPAEAQELDALLLADPEARAYYRCHAAVHVALGNLPEEVNKVVPMPASPGARRWPSFAAAAALVLAAGTAWWSLREDVPQASQDPLADKPGSTTKVLAVTYATDGLRWNLSQPPTSGQQLGPGIVRVFDGGLSLSLAGGRLLHVKGPAEFELIGEGEIFLRKGPAALRTIGGRGPFIVRLPKGALVDMGSDFSVDVGSDETAEVRVFEKELVASTVGPSGDTLEELQLRPGKSTLINSRISAGTRPASGFLRLPPVPLTAPPGGEQAYAAAVLRSSPLSYWRFEQTDPGGLVPDETGKHPLQLMDRARISGSEDQRYLVTNTSDASGFAVPAEGLADLDTARGVTIEGLLFSSSEGYGTAIALELIDAPPPDKKWSWIRHAPQTLLIERMGRKGEHIGHIHPDFALRAMLRSPAGYEGGINLYSRESHLLHRWLHMAAVHDGTSIRLYLDGELSATTPASLSFRNARLRPIIGRLQPHPQDELRQWVGGIDEVALYGRALPAEEIRAHAAALKP